MFDRIQSLFVDRGGGAEGPDKRHSTDELHLAAAVLLVEAARIDGRFEETERKTIKTLIQARFGLDPQETDHLLAEADREAAWAGELWSYVRVIKNRFSHAERVSLIEMLWEVAYADGVLHDYEANLLRRVGGLVYVSDRECGAARKRVLDRLGIGA